MALYNTSLTYQLANYSISFQTITFFHVFFKSLGGPHSWYTGFTKKWFGVLIINMLMLKMFPVPVLCFQKHPTYRAFKLSYNRGSSDYTWVFGVCRKLGLWVESLVTHITFETFDVYMPVHVYSELSPVIRPFGQLYLNFWRPVSWTFLACFWSNFLYIKGSLHTWNLNRSL